MLDATTRARIDSARDILVGKVPDPKSQVEQITIALIYKFMDDMDRQSEELGGKATFFTGDFKKYRWAQLLDKRYSGQERLLLYAEGIEKMNENKNIPQLFRDIFKGVFLPYRDPETLNLFLKEINGFSYDHSERLGDAFEYLLSILGTQGEAGQFRTPRHIIDFIVAVLDPKKNETILDPACGTAGFLISAYKHILAAHSQNGRARPTRPTTTAPLTPDERARLMQNFRGYDIAPDMVRLARANMYLHGFANPTIHEYDTLTSEERWDERCDVILANPPFMTPKGGIRPHNRFSIKAKRSEVLFVDYIAEHLTPGGRAGIIVPEGIIFQSQNAYKNLRKMLVENYLWAVVSLPAGVFNPYSGVKTSILFLDRNLAKRMDDVLFVKIENDGFDLGAQRRPIEKNDLPAALRALQEWKAAPRPTRPTDQTGSTHAVPRQRLLAAPDISLSGDRYRAVEIRPGKWPMVRVEDIVEILDSQRKPVKEADRRPGPYPYYGAMGIVDYVDEFLFDEVLVLVGEDGAKWGAFEGSAFVVRGKVWVNNHAHVLRALKDKVLPEYLAAILDSLNLRRYTTGVTVPKLTQANLRKIEIPLPPLAEQERLVAELEGYRKIIEAARQILNSYKPTLRIDPKWPMVKLVEVCEFASGLWKGEKQPLRTIRILRNTNFTKDGTLNYDDVAEHSVETRLLPDKLLKPGDVIIEKSGGGPTQPVGRVALFQKMDGEYSYSNFTARMRVTVNTLLPEFLWHMTHALYKSGATERLQKQTSGIRNLDFTTYKNLEIPLPPLPVQREIVAELEAERALVEANRDLITRMEQKLAAKLAEIWGVPSASDQSDQSDRSDSDP